MSYFRRKKSDSGNLLLQYIPKLDMQEIVYDNQLHDIFLVMAIYIFYKVNNNESQLSTRRYKQALVLQETLNCGTN